MNSNRIILIVLAALSLMLSFPKIKKESLILIVVTILVGFSVTKDAILSVSVGLILGSIYVSLNNASENSVEGFVSKYGKKKKSKKYKKAPAKKAKKAKNEENFDIDGIDENEENFDIDTKESFYQNYKALTPNQISGLNSDTKNLIATQKQLIETLSNMGPALKDGKQILDTFKGYFGNDVDIGKAMQSMKID